LTQNLPVSGAPECGISSVHAPASRSSQILGGPKWIRSRTCAMVDFHGLGASSHQVAPASANAATLCASSSRDRPAVVPNWMMSNGAALLRFFAINARTSRICSTVRSASISGDTGATPSYFAARRNGRGLGHVAAIQIGIRFCIGIGRKRIDLARHFPGRAAR